MQTEYEYQKARQQQALARINRAYEAHVAVAMDQFEQMKVMHDRMLEHLAAIKEQEVADVQAQFALPA